MNNVLTFLIICIGLRSLAVYLSYMNKLHTSLGILYILFGIGITTIYHHNLRPTGIETGGKQIWWNSYRPLFATIWILFGLASLYNKPYAWKILSLDVIIGLFLFFNKHYLKLF
jgi:hypothetical protein